MDESLLQAISMLSASGRAKCSYPQCSCHKGNAANNLLTLKSCAACGIATYCCRQSQKSDWSRHKNMCTSFRPFKETASDLHIEQKLSLDSISFYLPPIAEEYRKKYGSGIDVEHCFLIKFALSAVTDMVVSTNIRNLLTSEVNEKDEFKRWQEISPELFKFTATAQPGDVYVNKLYRPYDAGAPQQFRNTPLAEPAKLKNGTTIVDIGFVDFGIAYDSIDTINFQGSPVTVFGYDMEPFCVAKSMVMMEMIQDLTVSTHSVVEVWLSSLWSVATFRAFKKATESVLLKGETSSDLVETVKRIIRFWSQTPKMSAEAALKFQLQGMIQKGDSLFAMDCCSLASEIDRVSFLRYILTKALYEDESTTVGSVVMNIVNKEIGIKQIFASCFETAPARIHMPWDASFRKDSTVMDRTISYFEGNMQKFIRHVRNGTLIFIPKVGVAKVNNHVMIQEVKRKKPYIISWSKVIDYIAPGDFHKLARHISCDDTAHYVHTCNWSSRVYGTDIMDLNEKCRLHFYSSGLSFIEHSHALMEGFTKQGIYHFRDICHTVLGRKFCKQFFRYFFANQDVNCACFNGKTPLKLPYPLARTVSTAYFTFAYKETGITFGVDTYDYFSD